MEKKDEMAGRAKREYRRPSLRTIPLRPEEAVLGGCKTATTSGKNSGGGTTCSIPTSCSNPVS